MVLLNEVHNTMKLIELVKNRPDIYDGNILKITNKEYVDSLWQEVATEMGSGTTPDDCKKKWNSLRNGLSRDLRNEKDPSVKKRRKKWYFADNLYFLREFLNPKFKPANKVGDKSVKMAQDCNKQKNKTSLDLEIEYISSEESNDIDSKRSFASASTMNETTPLAYMVTPLTPAQPVPPAQPIPAAQPLPHASRVLTEPTQLASSFPHEIEDHYLIAPRSLAEPTLEPTSPHVIQDHYMFPSRALVEPILLAPSSPLEIEDHYLIAPKALKNPAKLATSPSRGTEDHYVNEYSFAKKRSADESKKFDEQNMTFFKSIIPDLLRLSERKQRLYKQNVLNKLNRLLDEQQT